jgi:hypothetical protein
VQGRAVATNVGSYFVAMWHLHIASVQELTPQHSWHSFLGERTGRCPFVSWTACCFLYTIII